MKFTWKCKIQSEQGETKEREVTAGWSPTYKEDTIKGDIAIVACIQENVATGVKHQPLGPARLIGAVHPKTQVGPLKLVTA